MLSDISEIGSVCSGVWCGSGVILTWLHDSHKGLAQRGERKQCVLETQTPFWGLFVSRHNVEVTDKFAQLATETTSHQLTV